MISLEKQIELLAELSINYQQHLIEHGNWEPFFNRNDLGIPFATLKYLNLAEWPNGKRERLKTEMLVRRSFYELCDELDLDRGRKHLSIPDMFRNSPNDEVVVVTDDLLLELERT